MATPSRPPRMGRATIARARPSVLYAPGSAAYWEFRDRQEQQRLEDDGSSEDGETPARGTPASEVRQVGRKSKRRSEQWAEQQEMERLREAQLAELATKDRVIDEVVVGRKATEQRLQKLQAEVEEERRRMCIERSEQQRELKELERDVAEKDELFRLEQRRRVCLEEEIEALNEKLQQAQAETHQVRIRLEQANEQASAAEKATARVGDERGAILAQVAEGQKKIAKLQMALAESEANRKAGMAATREYDCLNAQYADVKAQLAKAEREAVDAKAALAAKTEQAKAALAAKAEEVNLKARECEMCDKRMQRLASQTAQIDALKTEIMHMTNQLQAPREDETLRGQVDELRRENSRVREEKRHVQTMLDKANTDLRRLTRKNEKIVREANEAKAASALAADLQKRVQELTARLEGADGAGAEELARLRHQEAALQKLSEERLEQLQAAKAEVGELEAQVELLRAKATAVGEVSSDAEDEKDVPAAISMRDHEKLTAALFGWKVAKGRGSATWRTAPIHSTTGKAQWKSAELAVVAGDDGLVAAPSPLLDSYMRRFRDGPGAPAGDTSIPASTVIAAMFADFAVSST